MSLGVVQVVDGDTVIVQAPSTGTIRVRLQKIDAAEMNGRYLSETLFGGLAQG